MNGATSSTANPSGVQGICPDGWHVPSDAEWAQLTDYVSIQSQYVCGSNNSNVGKALASTTGWNSSTTECMVGNNQSANNSTGFGAVPAGYCNGSSCSISGYYAYLWSSSEHESYPSSAYVRDLYYNSAVTTRNATNKDNAISVRCLRD